MNLAFQNSISVLLVQILMEIKLLKKFRVTFGVLAFLILIVL